MTTASEHITIAKNLALPRAQDYAYLRSEGIRLIEQLGSKLWTDYNIHDPGITILETLCYAITDLSYRSSFEVKDLIAEEKPEQFNPDLQALFTARQILTTAPWTINDYRKLLVDLEGIRNAWIRCSRCNCGPEIYVDCKKSELTYTKPLPPEKPQDHQVIPKGLYDVLLELEDDSQSGDLNTGKVSLAYNMLLDGEPQTLYMEIRFPSVQELNTIEQSNAQITLFRHPQSVVKLVNAKVLSDKKNALVDMPASRVATALRGGIYITLQIAFEEFVTNPLIPTPQTIQLDNVPFRFVLLKSEIRKKLTLANIREILEDSSQAGVAARYLLKVQSADKAIAEAKKALQKHRNITEDFCCVEEISIEEIGICADVSVTPEADIEQVLSEAFYLIEEYLNPPIRFYPLNDMLEKKPVDEIFDGPQLAHGFIDEADLERSVLNRTLYASDIINLLMDIPGVVSLKNVALVRFDKVGNNIGSDAWKLEVKTNHLPRLYLEGSKFLVFKNGLPFLPDTAELLDTMHIVRGRNQMPKLTEHELDLEVPKGTYYSLQEYVPVQNSLPLVYGTGYEGLPSTASPLRKAQAKGLKSYLTFFEQILVNYLGQLAHAKHLFSIDNQLDKTYFPVFLDESYIKNDLYNTLDDFYMNFTGDTLQELTESRPDFLKRRNKFLDHLMARFSESFSDYALLLFSYKEQKALASQDLIHSKTSFLKQFPYQSAYKAQSFDYTEPVEICQQKDLSGLHHRISALLGLQPSLNYFEYSISSVNGKYSALLTLEDLEGNLLLTYAQPVEHENRDEVIRQLNLGMALILQYIIAKSNYQITPSGSEFIIELLDTTKPIARNNSSFGTHAEADARIDQIIAFAGKNLADDRFMIVEHILLRPHQVNDALLPVCVENDCSFCGEEDPYSYRVTFVFDGEKAQAKTHIEFRRFAEKTIRAELPAHVLAKICWVTTDAYAAFEAAYCAWLSAGESTKAVRLSALIEVFKDLKSIYPPPTLHDCVDGNDENRVFLNQTQL